MYNVDPKRLYKVNGGAQMYLDPKDGVVSLNLATLGYWEEEAVAVLERYADPAWTLLEAGAHIGYHTLRLARHFKDVIAFEPVMYLNDLLSRNVAINHLGNVACYRYALSDKREEVRLVVSPDDNSGASFVSDTLGTEVVQAVPLDDYTGIQALKLDLEGLEFKVLHASRTALKHVRVMLVECCNPQLQRGSGVTSGQFVRFLRGEGFSVRFALKPEEELDVRRLPHGSGYPNLLAIRA